MTDWLATLPDLLVPALGRALLDFLWQGLLIGLVTAAVLQLLGNARPQLRYAIACLAMLACVLVPTASVLIDLLPPASTGVVTTMTLPQVMAVAPTAVERVWPDRLTGMLPPGWQPLVVALWAAGASVLSLRMGVGVLWIRRLRAIPQGQDCAAWQARLDELAARFGLLRPVALRIIDGLDSPVSAGWLRPVVLLPSALLARMPVELLEALLAHELAHVRRHDYLVNLLQGLAEALLFYHPVTWWLSRRIRIEREQIADRLAAGVTGQPRQLALALSTLADLRDHRSAPLHLAQAAHGGQLMSRIQQLVQPGRRAAGGRIAFPLLGLAAACIAVVAHAQVSAPEPLPEASPAPATATASKPAALPAPAATRGPVLATPAPRPQAASVDHPERRHAFALVREGEQGMTLSGSSDDIDDIRAAREALGGEFIWFRDDGRAWVIDDPALVARADASWRELEHLAARMRATGDEMRVHGDRMEVLGERMRELAAGARDNEEMRAATARMRELALQQHGLGQQQARLAAEMGRADEARRQELEVRMETLSGRMEALSGQMEQQEEVIEAATAQLHANRAPIEVLGKRMEEARRPMEALDERMETLGRQQERHARQAERETRALIEEARRKGLAKPAPRGTATP